jgi:hypothetical protein
MVVKPTDGLVQGKKGLLQPAISAAAAHLRVLYGPTYTEAPNLDRLRQRGLAPMRVLALREFMLGHQALHRFALSSANRSIGCTNACSACWRLRASLWIRGFEGSCAASRRSRAKRPQFRSGVWCGRRPSVPATARVRISSRSS